MHLPRPRHRQLDTSLFRLDWERVRRELHAGKSQDCIDYLIDVDHEAHGPRRAVWLCRDADRGVGHEWHGTGQS